MRNFREKVGFKKKFAVNYFFTVMLICSFVIFAVAPVSCRMTEEGIEVIPSDKTCPVVEKFEVTSSKSFYFSCSEKILVSQAFVNEENSGDSGAELPVNKIVYDETGKNTTIILGDETRVGGNYVFNAVITDLSGNSVEFQQDFIGFNENPAVLIISEIRTKSDSSKKISDFVEFYCLKGGNTHGLKLCSSAKGENYDYIFPAIDVKAGEYITLHNKTFDEEKALNEFGDDLTLSAAEESCGTARDLWRNGTDSVIGAASDVLILKNFSTGQIYDGIPYCKSETEKWTKKLQSEYAELLFSKNIWKNGSDVSSAFYCDKATTLTRSISRKNVEEIAEKYASGEISFISSSLDDWALTEKYGSGKSVVSGATPGFANGKNYFIE